MQQGGGGRMRLAGWAWGDEGGVWFKDVIYVNKQSESLFYAPTYLVCV